MNEIFEEYYKNDNDLFDKLISDFCFKDDNVLIDSIIKLSNSLDLKIDKEMFLDNYINDYYSKDNIDELKENYLSLIINKIEEIKYNLNYLMSYCDGKYYDKIFSTLEPLLNSTDLESIKNNMLSF